VTLHARPFLLLALAVACGGEEESREAFDWREDDRLRVTLHTTAPRGHFDRDTGDMLPVMVEKLATGRPEVQNHYRGELAAAGERSVTLIEDLIQRYAATQNGTLVIGNSLGVLGLSDASSAVTTVRRMLGHPAESVRSAAIRAMGKLAQPEDYETLKSLMPLVSGELRRALVQAMGTADPERLAGDLSLWLKDDAEVGLLVLAARAVASSGAGHALSREVLTMKASDHPNLEPFLVAALAAAGDPEAGALLELLLRDDSELVRTRAMEAVTMSKQSGLLFDMAAEDPSETLRVLATEAVQELDDDRLLPTLREGTRDSSPKVRQASLRALLATGDSAAVGVFMEMLASGPSELGPALRAVRGLWDHQPGLEQRAAVALITTLEGMSDRALKEREPWIQALGQVPSGEASDWLLGLARVAEGDRHHLSAHRWLCLQVSNGGSIGQDTLIAAWRSEADPERRLDYLWAASMSRGSETVDFLVEVALGVASPDYERLFAAECLTRLGETLVVAPVLKRACLTITDPLVRPAFEELLWRWYG